MPVCVRRVPAFFAAAFDAVTVATLRPDLWTSWRDVLTLSGISSTTLVDSPPSDPRAWAYEIKFDGYRLMTRVDGADIKLFTRNGIDWTPKLGPLHKAIAKTKLPAGWYDGEMVTLDDNGVPDFGALQLSFDAAKTKDVVLYLFDLPYFDRHDLRAVPLRERRALLQGLLE